MKIAHMCFTGRGGGTAKQAGPAERGPGGSQAAAGSQEVEAEEEGQKKGGKRAAEKKKAGAKAGATKRPSPGTIKLHDGATGAVRNTACITLQENRNIGVLLMVVECCTQQDFLVMCILVCRWPQAEEGAPHDI